MKTCADVILYAISLKAPYKILSSYRPVWVFIVQRGPKVTEIQDNSGKKTYLKGKVLVVDCMLLQQLPFTVSAG